MHLELMKVMMRRLVVMHIPSSSRAHRPIHLPPFRRLSCNLSRLLNHFPSFRSRGVFRSTSFKKIIVGAMFEL